MRRMIEEYLDPTPSTIIADLGSLDVNGSHRDLIPPNCTYVGIDLSPGDNVDVVMTGEYSIPFPDNHFDALISGQCFEHVRNPFRLMEEVSRVVKPEGRVLMIAPFMFFEHRFPLDCWRFLCDGWQALFDECGIELIKTEYAREGKRQVHCWAIGKISKNV
jgi:SAM-dependent methyltransferase